MNDFEEIKRNYKGKAKSRRVQWIPLKMKLDKDNKPHRQFYDFSEDTVMISRYAVPFPEVNEKDQAGMLKKD